MSEPASIYIHIPFCVKKCGYCDFYSVTDQGRIPFYLEALIREIYAGPRTRKIIQSIYFGGGTPSLLTPDQAGRILSAVQGKFQLSPRPEITLEANPGTIDPEKLRGYAIAGINRLSIGVQSFDDGKLGFLTRIHTAKEAVNAVENARAAGFDNIGLDLMFGLPFETRAQWQKDLDRAVRLDPAHLSCYMLTIEPGTLLYNQVKKDRIKPKSCDLQADMFKQTSRFLKKAGYDHYEISNFARTRSLRSRHNTGYWQGRPYFGFGAAAHAFDGENRSWNHAGVEKYISCISSGSSPVEQTETLSVQQQMLEAVMLQLRTSDGIDTRGFEIKYKRPFASFFSQQIARVLDNGLAVWDQDCFMLTLEGRLRLNSIVDALAERILSSEP